MFLLCVLYFPLGGQQTHKEATGVCALRAICVYLEVTKSGEWEWPIHIFFCDVYIVITVSIILSRKVDCDVG